MNQVKLERVVVLGLRRSRDGVRNRPQRIIQGRGFDDFALLFQFIEDFLAQLLFFVLAMILSRQQSSHAPKTRKATRHSDQIQESLSNEFNPIHGPSPLAVTCSLQW